MLAFVQAVGTLTLIRQMGAITSAGYWAMAQIVITLVAGTSFLMWLGEQITDKGIGNGVSIIIFAGIVALLPAQLSSLIKVELFTNGNYAQVAVLLLTWLATVMFIVGLTQAQRKIPIQHVKRIVGNKMVGGQSSFLPLKVNSAGVIPIIFAISGSYFPTTHCGDFHAQ